MAKKKDNDLASNRQAFYNFEITETFEAGISLLGTEIKSLRDHGGNIKDAYVLITKNEAWLKNASIAPFKFGNIHNHEEKRERKLLLHKREIEQLKKFTQQKGLTIVPLALYLIKGKAKVKIGVAKGKKSHDKRSTIKERQENRDIQRAMKKEV